MKNKIINGSMIVLSAILAIVLSIVIMPADAFAAEISEDNLIAIEDFANNWIAQNYYDETEIDEIVPTANDDELSGYCISFELNGEPNGYVIWDLAESEVITFALDGESPYQKIKENTQETGYDEGTVQKVLFMDSLFDYSVETKKGNSYYEVDIEGNVNKISKSVSKEFLGTSGTLQDGFYDGYDLSTYNITYDRIPSVMSFTPYLMSYFSLGESVGNCGPTAVTNMLFYWRFMGRTGIYSNSMAVYSIIANTSDYNPDTGTSLSSCISSAKSYAQSCGYSVSSYRYLLESYAYFKRDIGNDYTILTLVRKDDSGHFVIAVGYRIYNSTGVRFLQIIDGWNTNVYQFINYDYFDHVYGCRWKI